MNKVLKQISSLSLFFLGIGLIPSSFAADDLTVTAVADHLVSGPIAILNMLMHGASFIVGIVLFVSAVQKYQHHKHNPIEASLPTVVIYFVLSIIMFLFPFFVRLSGSSML